MELEVYKMVLDPFNRFLIKKNESSDDVGVKVKTSIVKPITKS